jgi:hypothetical protein
MLNKMRRLEQPSIQLEEELKIIGGGIKGTRKEIAKFYHENAFNELPVLLITDIIELVEELEERMRHKKGIAHLDLISLLGRILNRIYYPEKKEEVFTPEIFGFYGEKMMRDFLREFEEVEIVERATQEEDWGQGIDMFVKFREIDMPLAIQFTFRSYENKKNLYGKKTVKKKENPKSEINPTDAVNCPLVLVRGSYRLFGEACDEWFRKSREKPKAKAIDYLSKKEKLHLLLQLMRTSNKEQKEVIERIIESYRKDKAPIIPPLSSWNPEELERLIERTQKMKIT